MPPPSNLKIVPEPLFQSAFFRQSWGALLPPVLKVGGATSPSDPPVPGPMFRDQRGIDTVTFHRPAGARRGFWCCAPSLPGVLGCPASHAGRAAQCTVCEPGGAQGARPGPASALRTEQVSISQSGADFAAAAVVTQMIDGVEHASPVMSYIKRTRRSFASGAWRLLCRDWPDCAQTWQTRIQPSKASSR